MSPDAAKILAHMRDCPTPSFRVVDLMVPLKMNRARLRAGLDELLELRAVSTLFGRTRYMVREVA